MSKLDLKPLEERRAQIKLKLFFKARQNLVEIPFTHLENTNSKRRHGNYAIPTSSVDSHLYSFYPNTIRLWNSLPNEAKSTQSLDVFNNGVAIRSRQRKKNSCEYEVTTHRRDLGYTY